MALGAEADVAGAGTILGCAMGVGISRGFATGGSLTGGASNGIDA